MAKKDRVLGAAGTCLFVWGAMYLLVTRQFAVLGIACAMALGFAWLVGGER